jgi:hypothetical protein
MRKAGARQRRCWRKLLSLLIEDMMRRGKGGDRATSRKRTCRSRTARATDSQGCGVPRPALVCDVGEGSAAAPGASPEAAGSSLAARSLRSLPACRSTGAAFADGIGGGSRFRSARWANVRMRSVRLAAPLRGLGASRLPQLRRAAPRAVRRAVLGRSVGALPSHPCERCAGPRFPEPMVCGRGSLDAVPPSFPPKGRGVDAESSGGLFQCG